MSSSARENLVSWIRTIDLTGKTVLDVGAGPASSWATKYASGTPSLYKTLDVDPSFGCDYVIDLNLDPRSPYNLIGEFDVVLCFEVLEHTWNPVKVIENLSRLTTETLYLSTPLVHPHHDKWDFLRFTGEWFQTVLPKVGFKTVTVQERVPRHPDNLKRFYSEEGLRVSKIRPEYGCYTYPIGYHITASK